MTSGSAKGEGIVAIVTLLTDFGLQDSYAAEMKGRILAANPRAAIIDVTHEIPPGAIRQAAWMLSRSWGAFPQSTIHIAIVDPGVGSERRAVVARAHGHFFVGPDNGLLHPVLATDAGSELREIRRGHRWGGGRGTTFDGRDLFAPAAGALAAGMPFEDIGPAAEEPVPLESFRLAPKENGWEAEVVAVDRYGNLITCAGEAFLRSTFGDAWRSIRVRSGSKEARTVQESYRDVSEGDLVLTIGSAGTLEISVNGGNASSSTEISVGDFIRIEPMR
jgi:S-adenosylmethionine hydrolase